jgi:hypothetical protein
MAWESFRANDGIYLIDWEGLARIIRSCKRAGAMNAYSRVVTQRGERDWAALGMRLPDLHSVEVDWDKVKPLRPIWRCEGSTPPPRVP